MSRRGRGGGGIPGEKWSRQRRVKVGAASAPLVEIPVTLESLARSPVPCWALPALRKRPEQATDTNEPPRFAHRWHIPASCDPNLASEMQPILLRSWPVELAGTRLPIRLRPVSRPGTCHALALSRSDSTLAGDNSRPSCSQQASGQVYLPSSPSRPSLPFRSTTKSVGLFLPSPITSR